MQEIGKIVSNMFEKSPSHLRFSFQTKKGVRVRSGDFVCVRHGQDLLVGQVQTPYSINEYYGNPRTVEATLEDRAPEGLIPSGFGGWNLADASILGLWDGSTCEMVGENPQPGDKVLLLDEDTLKQVLGIPDDGIYLGLWRAHRQKVKIKVNSLSTLAHNLLICGKIGSGKTYTGGVLIEEYMDAGFPVVVIDPHGELGTLSEPNDDAEEMKTMKMFDVSPKKYNVRLYAPRGYVGPNEDLFTIKAGELSYSDIVSVVGLPGDMQQKVVITAIRNLRERLRTDYDLGVLKAEIDRIGKKGYGTGTISTVKLRLDVLDDLGLLGDGLSPSDLVQEDTISIVTLPNVDMTVQQIVVAILAKKLLNARIAGRIPPFLLYVEEGHLFAPKDNPPSKGALVNFAKEIRKFGAGLCISTQQPSDLDKRLVNQCHTRIFLQLDSAEDIRFIKPYVGATSADVIDMLPYFPPGRALLICKDIRYPLIADIRTRKSLHGGKTGEVHYARRSVRKEPNTTKNRSRDYDISSLDWFKDALPDREEDT